jgi:hypothetical protein
MKERTKNRTTHLVMAICSIAVGILVALTAINYISPEQYDEIQRSWSTVADNATPGSTTSGIINVFIMEHGHGVDLATTEITEGHSSVYAHFDATASLNTTLEGEIPYDTEFDIVVLMQYNQIHAYNTSSSAFEVDYVNAQITSADLSINADTDMSKPAGDGETPFCTINGTNHARIQFYMDNSGSGYTMSHGETFNVTSLNLQAYY